MGGNFQLTVIAEDSVDIEDVTNPPERSELLYPVPETSESFDDQTRRTQKEERYKQAQQAYKEEARRRKAENNAKFSGSQIGDIDKKLKSQLYLALGKKEQNISHTKTP